jgi:hypothetical protein
MAMSITASDLPRQLMNVLRAGHVPYIAGSPGLGKSSIIKQIAADNELKLIDIRLAQADITDLNGMPFMNQKTGKASFFPFDMWPTEEQEIPEGYKGWIILLDELSSCSQSIQAAAYKVILDRQVGMHTLHKHVLLVAAGNLTTDKAIVTRMSTALQSRMVHFQIEIDHKGWVDWANENDIDHRIVSFINFAPDSLHKFDPNHNDVTHPNPRTWEFLSDIIKPMDVLNINDMATFAGTVSEGMAREFYGYTQIFESLPNIKDIINDPANAKLGNENSAYYAVTGLISHHMSPTNVKPLLQYLERLSIEFQVISLRGAVKKNNKITRTPEVMKWMQKVGLDYFN